MKRTFILSLGISLSFAGVSLAQNMKHQTKTGNPASISHLNRPTTLKYADDVPRPSGVPNAERSVFESDLDNFQSIPFPKNLSKTARLQASSQKIVRNKQGLPVWIEGRPEGLTISSRNATEHTTQYLEGIKNTLNVKVAQEELQVIGQDVDELGQNHVRLQQMYKNVPIYGAEAVLHLGGKTEILNGRIYPTPTAVKEVTPTISAAQATETVRQTLAATKEIFLPEEIKKWVKQDQAQSELVIYHKNQAIDAAALAWHVTFFPNLIERWEYFIDAKNNQIIHHYRHVCQFDGGEEVRHLRSNYDEIKAETREQEANIPLAAPKFSFDPLDGAATAPSLDLSGLTQTLNTYRVGNTFFLIDASRPMFSAAQSQLPDDPAGAIWTLDAVNTSPTKRASFTEQHVTSSNNSWSSKTATSAHFNSGKVYEYYLNNYKRSSVDGKGGTIVSFVNVADEDGKSMGNAYWNGAAIFYGNGDSYFTSPLARSLDVAAHEISHGVIQNSRANLDYESESGALNESFADVFGVLIDRTNWKVGESVVSTRYFPTGALRDVSDPNNGGRSLQDAGWQPKTVSQQYFGSEDNGGVHINSGIPNYAFYLFANNPAVGKDKAEKVYYRTLTTYLVKSSQFLDMRLGVLRAATDLYGANSAVYTAAVSAFDQVGIKEVTTGGGTTTPQPNNPTTSAKDLEINKGQDYIIHSDATLGTIILSRTTGAKIATIYTGGVGASSRISVTDDGSVAVFVGSNKNLYYIDLTVASPKAQLLDDQYKWGNVAISKDGSLIAAVEDPDDLNLDAADYVASMFIYNFGTKKSKWYGLYNPTSANGGRTNDVRYADALEWSYDGERVLYDAFNKIGKLGKGLEYYDMNFIKVYDKKAKRLLEANEYKITKIFSDVPENVSLGNGTFAKNSPYIIGLDYYSYDPATDKEEYAVLGLNYITGDNDVFYENNTIGYPNYSRLDDKILFDTKAQSGNQVIGVVGVDRTTKISPTGNPAVLIAAAQRGNWFATGVRSLSTSIDELTTENKLQIFPNPTTNEVNLVFEMASSDAVSVEIFDILGKRLTMQKIQAIQGENKLNLSLENMPSGTYLLKMQLGNKIGTSKIVKY